MINLLKQKWTLNTYGLNMPKRPTIKDNEWSVTIKPNQIASYFIIDKEIDLKESLKKTPKAIDFSISTFLDEGVTVNYKTQPDNTGNQPAKARIILMDDMFGANDRWFSKEGLLVDQNGTTSSTFSLSTTGWQNVYGKSADNKVRKKSFSELKSKPIKIAICFGGGSFFGHGITPVGGNMKININYLNIS